MKILHISDTHYGQSGALARCQRTILAMLERDDLDQCILVHTGDVIDSPSPRGRQFGTARSHLVQLAKRCLGALWCPGNHDVAVAGLARWAEGDQLWREFVQSMGSPFDEYPAQIVVDNTAIIIADSNRRPSGRLAQMAESAIAAGYLGEPQISAIAHAVEQHREAGLRVVLALHHCPSGGNPALRLRDRKELGIELSRAGGVDVMLTGHLHQRMIWPGKQHGAEVILSAPKCGEPHGYWEITMGDEGECQWVLA